MLNNTQYNSKMIKSWEKKKGLYTTEQILNWVKMKNESTNVLIQKIPFGLDGDWILDDNGFIRNNSNTFFKIVGIRRKIDNRLIEQPIIDQSEIGFLGIIIKEFDGVIHFLMQAKIEPGNINTVQISPTIQATKSNFTQKHGGKKPLYLDFFMNAKPESILVDQLQSEQSSRFISKRNRNMIIMINEEIEVYDSHMWVTLGQIKDLMRIDNLVNMDTRTVISCIPFELDENFLSDNYVFNSLILPSKYSLVEVFNILNDYKMFNDSKYQIISLDNLEKWKFIEGELVSKEASFKVIYTKIMIDKREVLEWYQPLFEATGMALFGLILYRNNIDKKVEVLVKLKPEIGSFDSVELGPTLQKESDEKLTDHIEKWLYTEIINQKNVLIDVILSEEGGRFYHEQNRNVIIEIDNKESLKLTDNYIWLDLRIINDLIKVNNVLNIQLRNLISLMER